MSAVMCMQAAYAFVDVRRNRTDKATRGDYNGACIEEDVPEVPMSADNQ